MRAECSERSQASVFQQLAGLLISQESLKEVRDEFERGLAKIHAALARNSSDREPDGWLDSKAAAKYMGNLSRTSFDKYRYQTQPKLKGYPLDGKILYKRSDIDRFVMLYGLKSEGLA